MNILYYFWGENSKDDMIDSLRESGHSVYLTSAFLPDYDNATACEQIFQPILDAHAIDLIFSFNYFPAISRFAHTHQLRYASWVYDCPHLTLYSTTISNPENYIFLFDQNLCETVKQLGAVNVFHLPLAFHDIRLRQQLAPINSYSYEVSFVGSLYSQSTFDQFPALPPYLAGYLEGIICAQRKIWGYDLISDLLTESLVSKLDQFIGFSPLAEYTITNKLLYADIIQKKVTSLDRHELLAAVQKEYPLALFTAASETLPAGMTNLGYVDYRNTMPGIFKQSKINLNISLRSITSGIPLRAIDILGAGGFLLSNYQPELAQYLVAGEDYVSFENASELLTLIDYYLHHDKERQEIAVCGHQKALSLFTYRHAIEEIMRDCAD
jgi:spore maturation protein CgeB